jgi:hypothetical protein
MLRHPAGRHGSGRGPSLAAMTNPLGHLYGDRLVDPPERFLGELDGETTRRRKGMRPGLGLPWEAALMNHPAALAAAVGTLGVAAAVLRVLARRRRSPR